MRQDAGQEGGDLDQISNPHAGIGEDGGARSIYAPLPGGPVNRTLHELQTPDKPRASHSLVTRMLLGWTAPDGIDVPD
jgi:hypothetical protein